MKKFKFKIQGNEYEVEIKSFENNVAEIEVNGSTYSVEVDRAAPQAKTPKLMRPAVHIPAGADIIQKTSEGGELSVKSPLPGIIIKILVKEGDAVKKGDKLMIMEAMKMENNVLCEKDGIVKSIKAAIGQNVLQGDVLLEIL